MTNKLSFRVQQVAICPSNPAAALELLTAMGAEEWVKDQVRADGDVFEQPGSNVANLAFDYSLLQEAREFEVLNYVEGPNWMSAHRDRVNSASHLGMHVTAEELVRWREFFAERGIGVAQEVFTQSHTNQFLIDNGRKFNYVIFDTKAILGIDIKFIVRIEKA